MEPNQIIVGDALEVLKTLPDSYVDSIMTSPPYWNLRDYGRNVETVWDAKEDCEHEWGNKIISKLRTSTGPNATVGANINEYQPKQLEKGSFCNKCGAWKGQLGLEPTFELYIKHLCDIFDEIKRVLKNTGTCWVNLGDTYGTQSGAMRDGKFGPKNTNNQKIIQPKGTHKCLTMIPFRFAIEMVGRGWILRNTIIWHKPNAMPSSAKDRFTVDFEYLFFFSKSKNYYFETQREGEQGRNKRCIWKLSTKPFKEAHFAVYPEQLCETPIKAGCPDQGIVLDPFFGSGTTGLEALKQGKKFIGIELNQEYIPIAKKRLKDYLGQIKLRKAS